MTKPRAVTPGVEISAWSDQKWVRGISHIGAMTEVATAWDAAVHVWVDLALSDDRYFIDATLRVNASPPVEELALRLGDAIHCFRSALDSLAWSLCHLDGAAPAEPKGVYFPCAPTEARWKKAAKALVSMPTEFLERIHQVQPFNTGPRSPLQLLVDMSNQDKHRGMITGRANPSAFRVGVHTGGATGSRNGITDGLRVEFLNPEMKLLDNLPFARVETSVPVDLMHDREPVGLEYFVSVGDQEYPLRDIQMGLIQLQQVMIFVREGHFPPALLPTA